MNELNSEEEEIMLDRQTLADTIRNERIEQIQKLPFRQRVEQIFRDHGKVISISFLVTVVISLIIGIIESVMKRIESAAKKLKDGGDGDDSGGGGKKGKKFWDVIKTIGKNIWKLISWLLTDVLWPIFKKLLSLTKDGLIWLMKHLWFLLVPIFLGAIAYLWKSANGK